MKSKAKGQQLMAKRFFFGRNQSQSLSQSEQGTKYVLHKKGIYEFFMVALRKEVSVIKCTVMGWKELNHEGHGLPERSEKGISRMGPEKNLLLAA